MSKWPKQTIGDLNAFYGNPDPIHNGSADRHWEDLHLVNVIPPYRMRLAWDVTKFVKFIRVNQRCGDSLRRVLDGIRDHYGSQEEIEKARMDRYGGAYAFRLMRGGHSLSVHSWGAAIDLDPEGNSFGSHHFSMPEEVIELFRKESWVWGGAWAKPDAMHFQAAEV